MFDTLFEQFSWSATLFNIFCSLLASFIFILVLLMFLKPKIKIVENIAEYEIDIDRTGKKKVFLFKIINKSLFSAYEIKAELSSYTIKQGENGITDKIYTLLSLRNDSISHVDRCNPFKNNGKNCLIFVCFEDIRNLLDNEDVNIQLLISAKHGLTGLNGIFKFSFINKQYVKIGKFVSGNSEEIK